MLDASGSGPTRFGPYRVRRPLSAGGMGVLYEAEHEATGQRAAIKTVKLLRGATLAGIRTEIFALASLAHPGIARVLDQGVVGGSPWYAMELLVGETLAQHGARLWSSVKDSGRDQAATLLLPTIGPTGALTSGECANPAASPAAVDGVRPAAAAGRLGETLLMALKLCAPLAHVHGRGLVHRDLKPDNVILSSGTTPVLIDFGLVTHFPGPLAREVLGSGVMAGTLAYMSPEQIRLEAVDARADLYAVGNILHELVAGQRPFTAAHPDHLLEQHLHQTPVPVSSLVSGVPPALDALILRLLAKRPRDRFGHARDLATELAEILRLLADPTIPGDEIARALAEVPATSYLYRSEMVGRQRALSVLTEQMDRAAGGHGGSCLLSGESGLGKTMLAAAVGRAATLRQLRVVTAQCQALRQASAEGEAVDVPLQPFRALLQALSDHAREHGPDITSRILGAHARLLRSLEPSLAELPGLSDDDGAPVSLDTEAARTSVLAALTQVLLAWSAERPLVLLVDDIQWADELSLAFLQALSARSLTGQSVFVLATYRPEEVSRPLQELLDGWGGARLVLQRLDDDGVSSMVAQILGIERVPPAMAEFVARTSGGNPFFIAEYVRAAVVEGLLVREHGTWQTTQLAADARAYQVLPLPDSLEGLIRHRLSHLSPTAMQAAEAAAVIGREVDERLMAAVLGQDPVAVAALCAELLNRHILELTSDGPLRFSHDKIRELTQSGIAPARRRAIHLLVAEALERLGEASPYRLAHHFREAGRVNEAFHHGHAAGHQALAAGAYHEAHEQLLATLQLVQAQPQGVAVSTFALAQLHRLTAEAATAIGDLEAGERLLTEAHRLLSRPLPERSAGWWLLLLREGARQLAHRLLPARFMRAPAGRRPALSETALITGQLGFAYMFRNLPTPMLAVMVRSANLAESAEFVGPRAIAYSILATLLGVLRASRPSRWYFARARDAADRSGLTESFHQAQIEGFFHVNGARWAQARGLLEPALARSQQLGVVYEEEAFRLALSALEILTGDLPAAEQHLQAVASSARPLGNRLHEWWGRKYEGLCLVHRGFFRQALATLAPAEQGFRARGNVVDWLGVLALSAVAHARLGQLDQAVAKADEARLLAKQNPGALYHTFELHTFLPEVYLSAWRAPKREGAGEETGSSASAALARRAQRQIAAARRFAQAFPIGGPMFLRHLAQQAMLQGRHRRALALGRRSVARAIQLQMPLEEAFARLDLAQQPALPVGERPAELQQAVDLLGRLGCTWHLQRAAGA